MAVQCTGKVSHDHDRTFEDTDNEDVAAFVVLIDLRREFRDTRLDLLFGVKNVLEICLDVV